MKALSITIILLSLLVMQPCIYGDNAEAFKTKNCGSREIKRLCVRCLQVNGSLAVNGQFFLNGVDVTNSLGTVGATGPTGATGATGSGGVLGAAYFINMNDQTVNPTEAFIFDTELFNSIPSDIIASTPTSEGTLFTLSAGTYIFNYEMTFDSDGAVGIFDATGGFPLASSPLSGSLVGADERWTWIHGRYIQVFATPTVVAIGPVDHDVTLTIPNSIVEGTLIRLTILKIS